MRVVCAICGEVFTGAVNRKTCSPECRNQYQRRYQTQWRRKNPDYLRAWKNAHPEALARYRLHWHTNRANDPDYKHRWYMAHREQMLAAVQKRKREKLAEILSGVKTR